MEVRGDWRVTANRYWVCLGDNDNALKLGSDDSCIMSGNFCDLWKYPY